MRPSALPPAMVGPDTFRFLNVERRCAGAAGWQPPGADKLWVYNLHYFDDLNALDAPTRAGWHRDLLLRWVAQNPPGPGDAWEPYALSRRIANWVKWSACGNVLPRECIESLAVQSRWLMQRLEYHLLGNHLFMNAKALVHAGLYFEGAEAEAWLRKGLRIIAAELDEQVLADGAHFELSPMYHAAMLEDMLDLVNLMRACGMQIPQKWLDVIVRMDGWLGWMTHPDGDISFFNDSAFGIAPSRGELQAYAARLDIALESGTDAALRVLADSGYVSANAGPARLIADCARIGPDYLPGHAHADTLSFELSLFGTRVLVNSGTSVYGAGPERQRQRGTAAHNTVVVDGENSSEVWAGFRVARRARPTLLRTVDRSEVVIEASHDGYRRLRGGNVHRRCWTLAQRALRIEDSVSGRFERAQAFFHLHPLVRARASARNVFELTLPEGRTLSLAFDAPDLAELRPASWHPRFGVCVDSSCLVARLHAGSLVTRLEWTP